LAHPVHKLFFTSELSQTARMGRKNYQLILASIFEILISMISIKILQATEKKS